MNRKSRIALVCGALSLVLACGGSARIVRQTQTGGEIALAGDRQAAMKEARREIRAHCQGPFTIIEQGEVAVGDDAARAGTPEVGDGEAGDGEAGGAPGDEASAAAMEERGDESRPATEWRVQYMCGNAALSPAPGAGPASDPGEPPPGAPGDY